MLLFLDPQQEIRATAAPGWRYFRNGGDELRATHSAVMPGYHLNKRHWNTVILDGTLPDRLIKDMVEDSYDLVVSALPQARQAALGWQPSN